MNLRYTQVCLHGFGYRLPPVEGSVHSMNHIVFRRQTSPDDKESGTDLSRIQGKVVELQLPTHLEDISSTFQRFFSA